MLKALFSSKARIKLLKLLLLHPEQEFYVRELTRKLDEQINSIRRELLSFKKIGLVKYRTRNRKKYFSVNTDFLLFPELQSIFQKTQNIQADILQFLKKRGKIDFLAFSGIFSGKPDALADLLIVGEIDKEDLELFLEELPTENRVKYSFMDRSNFLYRLEYNDSFLGSILKDPNTSIPINNFKEQVNS